MVCFKINVFVSNLEDKVAPNMVVVNAFDEAEIGDLIVGVLSGLTWVDTDNLDILYESVMDESVVLMVERHSNLVTAKLPSESELMQLRHGPKKINALRDLAEEIQRHCVGSSGESNQRGNNANASSA